MTAALQPRPGFDWSRVRWGAPRARPTEVCSYCRTPLREDEVPLILFHRTGWCAEFCAACQKTWWGMS